MTIEAKLADGTILRFPDGTDPQVIQSAVKSMIGGGVKESPQEIDINGNIGPFESGLISAGRGMTTIGRALGLAEPEAPIVTEQFEKLQEKRPISTTIGEIAGQSAPFLLPGAGVGAIAGTGARVAATAGLGAVEGGLISRGEGRNEIEQIGSAGLGGIIAGSLELALPRIGRIGRQAVRRVTGKAPLNAVMDSSGNPTQEFLEAIRVEGKSFDDVVSQVNEELVDEGLNPDQVARKAFFESQGLQPTRAQVTRDAADFQAQQEATKTSGRVRNAIEVQESALTSRFDNAVLGTSGNPSAPTSTITDALVEKATVLDKEIGRLYTEARELAPGDKAVRFSSLSENLRTLAPSNTKSGGNIEAIVGELQSKGVLDKDMNLVGRISVETAEDVRQFMNSLHDPMNGFGNGVIRQLKETLDDDVFRAAGKDTFDSARIAKRDFEQELTRSKISKFDQRNSNLVRDVLENKVDPNRFADQVVFGKKYRAEDLSQLKDYVSNTESGVSGLNDLRAEVLDLIKERSFIGPEDAAGNKALSRDKLGKALSSIGDGKLNILFTPEENKFFRDMMEIAKMREPVRGTQQGRGPSAQAIGALENKLRDLPILGALVRVVDFDLSGRAVLKGSAKRLPALPSSARQGISQAAAIGGVTAVNQDSENQ